MLDFEKNFIPLVNQLELNNIPHTILSTGDGLKIVFQDGSDVALNNFTYGHAEGELEGYRGVFKDTFDDVTGYMTWQDVCHKLNIPIVNYLRGLSEN